MKNNRTGKAENHIKGQNHHNKVQDQTPACIGIFYILVHMQDVDPHSRAPKEDSGYGTKILLQDPRYLFY